MNLYTTTTFEISKTVTKRYSTSFYTASCLFHKQIRNAIFSIYGFVRVADEIVDTFHEYDKQTLLLEFEKEYYKAFHSGISVNPILHSFQYTVKQYAIDDAHVKAFLQSMKADLQKHVYSEDSDISQYIYGSADVVGLMCLRVFCNGDSQLYAQLEQPAKRLGSAFQKVNFLRDLKTDIEELKRSYFPSVSRDTFTEETKQMIVEDIEQDFEAAYKGIQQLPKNSKLAVFIAFLYYKALLQKIKKTSARTVLQQRIRVSGMYKTVLLCKAIMLYVSKQV